jgi:hypothetical protein
MKDKQRKIIQWTPEQRAQHHSRSDAMNIEQRLPTQ